MPPAVVTHHGMLGCGGERPGKAAPLRHRPETLMEQDDDRLVGAAAPGKPPDPQATPVRQERNVIHVVGQDDPQIGDAE